MLTPDDLIPSQCYFQVLYYDRTSTFPLIQTLIFIGKNIEKYHENIKEDEWFFQDLESYVQNGSFVDLPKEVECEIYIHHEDAVCGMSDFDGLINELMQLKKKTSGLK